MPWQRDYGRVKVDERRGERCFCDKSEAERAGWRRAAREGCALHLTLGSRAALSPISANFERHWVKSTELPARKIQFQFKCAEIQRLAQEIYDLKLTTLQKDSWFFRKA